MYPGISGHSGGRKEGEQGDERKHSVESVSDGHTVLCVGAESVIRKHEREVAKKQGEQ